MLKICSSCKQSLVLSMFNKNSSAKDGLQNQCKLCYAISSKKCYEKRKLNGKIDFKSDEYKQKRKDTYKLNRDSVLSTRRIYRQNNKETINRLNRLDYQKHKNKRLITLKAYSHKNADYLRKKNRERYQINKNYYSIKQKEYLQTENGKLNAKKARSKRKALVRNATIGIVDIKKITKIKVCYWCGVKLKKVYHLDHYVPISKGGSHCTDNLVISCSKCNLSKGSKDPFEFAKQVQKLF